MKKLLLFFIIIILSGCSIASDNPKKATEEFFKKYQTVSKEVEEQLDLISGNQDDLNNDLKDKYKKVIERQYKNLTYEIKDERFDGNTAIVTVEIEVYDFYKELNNSRGEMDIQKYNEDRIKKMEDTKDRIKYTLDIYLTKKEEKWLVDNLTASDREKIHGVYEY